MAAIGWMASLLAKTLIQPIEAVRCFQAVLCKTRLKLFLIGSVVSIAAF
ncbi:hypothetical protein [Bradyrhizobium genosp. A]